MFRTRASRSLQLPNSKRQKVDPIADILDIEIEAFEKEFVRGLKAGSQKTKQLLAKLDKLKETVVKKLFLVPQKYSRLEILYDGNFTKTRDDGQYLPRQTLSVKASPRSDNEVGWEVKGFEPKIQKEVEKFLNVGHRFQTAEIEGNGELSSKFVLMFVQNQMVESLLLYSPLDDLEIPDKFKCTLKELTLCGHADERIANLIRKCLTSSKSLKTLNMTDMAHLTGNAANEIWEGVGESTCIQELSLGEEILFDTDNLSNLPEAIKHNKSLKLITASEDLNKDQMSLIKPPCSGQGPCNFT